MLMDANSTMMLHIVVTEPFGMMTTLMPTSCAVSAVADPNSKARSIRMEFRFQNRFSITLWT